MQNMGRPGRRLQPSGRVGTEHQEQGEHDKRQNAHELNLEPDVIAW